MDKLTAARRSENMRRIRSKHTKPEIIVRQLIRSLGLKGYRLHGVELPGSPDLVWRKQKFAIFVNGCFWHGHNCKEGQRRPKSRLDYWIPKIERNAKRDQKHRRALRKLGWKTLTVWECQLRDFEGVARKIKTAFRG